MALPRLGRRYLRSSMKLGWLRASGNVAQAFDLGAAHRSGRAVGRQVEVLLVQLERLRPVAGHAVGLRSVIRELGALLGIEHRAEVCSRRVVATGLVRGVALRVQR